MTEDSRINKKTVEDILCIFDTGDNNANEVASYEPYKWEKGLNKSWNEVKEYSDQNELLIRDHSNYYFELFTDFVKGTNNSNLLLKVDSDNRIDPSNILAHYKENISSCIQLRKGFLRKLVIVLDLTCDMLQNDFQPTRYIAALTGLQKFIKGFSITNPLSMIAIVGMENQTSVCLCEFTSSCNELLKTLNDLYSYNYTGFPSLTTGIHAAFALLGSSPVHYTKEILIIYGSLLTVDEYSVHDELPRLKKKDITISIVSFSPLIHILQQLSELSGGQYLPCSGDHNDFETKLLSFITYSPVKSNLLTCLIKVGLPRKLIHSDSHNLTVCSCHNKSHRITYMCPVCKAQNCQIPSTCFTCGTMLILSHSLSRTTSSLLAPSPFPKIGLYIPLYSVKNREPNESKGKEPTYITLDELQLQYKSDMNQNNLTFKIPPNIFLQTFQKSSFTCQACDSSITTAVSLCPKCDAIFCSNCDEFLHNTLAMCPICIEVSFNT